MLNDCFDQGTLVGIQIINDMIKCINDFYEYVKNIEQNAKTMTEYTFKSPYTMASDDLKGLKMVLNNWYDIYLLV